MVLKLLLGLVVIVIVAAAGLAVYGSRVSPPQQTYEQAVPNERFAE